ncbi:hypothetical protein TI05_18160 [Achromatium sp. WMS3]|nr:hypothetical protein TI05_18160 [Achromatium sp. WMS3]
MELRMALDKQQSFETTILNYTKSGKPFWVHINCDPLFDAAGTLQGFMAIETDITEQKKAEETLLRTNQRLQLAAQSAKFGVWDYDPIDNTLEWDEWMFHLYGLDPQTFTGAYDAWQQVIHPDDKTVTNEEVVMALRNDRVFDTEFRIIWPNGEIRYIKANASVVRDKDGQALRMTGINYDITAQKRAELSLQEQARHTQSIIDNLVDGLITIDATGIVISFNPAAERIFGYSAFFCSVISVSIAIKPCKVPAASNRGSQLICTQNGLPDFV